MIETKNFKTRCEIIQRQSPRINGNNQYRGKTVVALDGGYSAVKGVSPDRAFSYPSYAKLVPKELEVVGKMKQTDIQFRNNATGEIWLIGDLAQQFMETTDIEATTDASLYTRYRYESGVYKALMATGMCLGLLGTSPSNEIYLQTGLPATYKERDEAKLVKALAGHYDVAIKLGNSKWQDFCFDLDEAHIGVMEQPQGTMCALAYENGAVSKDGMALLSSPAIIFDIGFGTEDTYYIRAGAKQGHRTYSDTGMRAVFDKVIEILQRETPAEYKVFEFQSYLESGQAPYFDPEDLKMSYTAFGEYLEQANRELCEKSVRRLLQDHDNLRDVRYLIVTGGTGESRFEQIKEMLSGIPNLQVVPGNRTNPDMPFSYSNVLGYYALRHAKLTAEVQRAEAASGEKA